MLLLCIYALVKRRRVEKYPTIRKTENDLCHRAGKDRQLPDCNFVTDANSGCGQYSPFQENCYGNPVWKFSPNCLHPISQTNCLYCIKWTQSRTRGKYSIANRIVQVTAASNWSFRKSTHWHLPMAVISPLLSLPEKQPPQWLLSFTRLSGSNHPSRVDPPLFKFCLQRRPRRKDQIRSALACCSSAAGSSRDPAPFAPSPCGWRRRGSFSNQTWWWGLLIRSALLFAQPEGKSLQWGI